MNLVVTHIMTLAAGICIGVFSRVVFSRKHRAGELNIFYRDDIPYLSLALNSFESLSRKKWACFKIVRHEHTRD